VEHLRVGTGIERGVAVARHQIVGVDVTMVFGVVQIRQYVPEVMVRAGGRRQAVHRCTATR
jgi:hypothetical protein